MEAHFENQLQLTGCAFSKACRKASTRRCKSRTSRKGPHQLGVWKWRMSMNCGQKSWKLRENTGMIIESLWIIYVCNLFTLLSDYLGSKKCKWGGDPPRLRNEEQPSMERWQTTHLAVRSVEKPTNLQITWAWYMRKSVNSPWQKQTTESLTLPPLRNVRLGFITMVSILEFWSFMSPSKFLRCVSSRFHHVQSSPSGLNMFEPLHNISVVHSIPGTWEDSCEAWEPLVLCSAEYCRA